MKVEFSYGKGVLTVNLPENSHVMESKGGDFIRTPYEEIQRAVRNPIGTKPLVEIVKSKTRIEDVCVVVSDHTRAVPNRIILPPFLQELQKAGISPGQIIFLVASGMHRPTSRKEKVELLGRDIAEKYRVIDHDAKNPGGLARVRRNGREFFVNRTYAEADLKILTGLIEPHFMAGFSGGRKSICPGIAGMETIKYFHSPALLESPFANTGTLAGNPCHEFASEMAEAAGADFVLNVTLDKKKKITGIFAGDIKKAHLAGTRHCEKENLVYVDKPFEIVITGNGGYPLDRDLYQTVKGLVSAADIVAEGGLIICFSECVDGIGSENFRNLLFGMENSRKFLKMISKPGFFVPDQWEVEELIKVLNKAKVRIYSSGLKGREIEKAHMAPVKDIDKTIKDSLREYGKKVSVAAIPDGPYTMVKIKNRKKYV